MFTMLMVHFPNINFNDILYEKQSSVMFFKLINKIPLTNKAAREYVF